MSPDPEPPPPLLSPPAPAPAREAGVVALSVAAAAAAAAAVVVDGEAATGGSGGGGGKKWGSRIMLVRKIGFKPGGGTSVSGGRERSSGSCGRTWLCVFVCVVGVGVGGFLLSPVSHSFLLVS